MKNIKVDPNLIRLRIVQIKGNDVFIVNITKSKVQVCFRSRVKFINLKMGVH
jgi:hypothetical protein